MRLLLLALMLALAAVPAGAQVTPADTTRRPLVVARDTIVPDTAAMRRGITPRGAFLRSLVLPGWGQSELGVPERGIIYFALEAGSLWMVYKSTQKLYEAKDRERFLRATGQLEPGQRSGLVRDRRAQREDWLTLSIFWLFFSGADAFVAAHLRDFDAHVEIQPDGDGAVRLQATIPVGKRR
jgi:hypothetical protein